MDSTTNFWKNQLDRRRTKKSQIGKLFSIMKIFDEIHTPDQRVWPLLNLISIWERQNKSKWGALDFRKNIFLVKQRKLETFFDSDF